MYELDAYGYDIQSTFVFEPPLPGNDAFADAFDAKFNSPQAPTWRITHSQDPVVHVPTWWMGYSTVGTEVYYGGDVGVDGGRVCVGRWDYTCSYKWPLSTTLQHIPDHCECPLLQNSDS